MMRVLDLFSGIGGFSLGLERTGGFRTVAFCEIDPFCRRVLAKHWPEVPCYDDVRSLTAERLRADGIEPDVLCGGFPCQDISFAGAGAGIDGERSGLWSEYARLIGELRPRYVLVENVAALLVRGLERVFGDLAALGFDAEWHCIPASAVGAPHRRDRVWIVAYAARELSHGTRTGAEQAGWGEHPDCREDVADADIPGLAQREGERSHPRPQLATAERGGGADVDHTVCQRRDAGWDDHAEHDGQQFGATGEHASGLADAARQGRAQPIRAGGPLLRAGSREYAGLLCGVGDTWLSEPDVGRVADGVPSRVDRLRGLGNAVVPQVPELIGRAILAAGAGA